jgi:phospho-N-acetylmuramoyl-pentapeptide-transferase
MNATNCSDGVDALAGSLTLISLVCLAALLYVVIGYAPVAKYLLLPFNPQAARWAILLMTVAGSLCGYLWWNAEPSKVLMGDAGSRFLGMLVGVGVLVTGNPVLVFAVAPIVLVNGGGGLGKLVLLRTLKKFGMEVRHPSVLTELEQAAQSPFVRIVHSVRFPLHDHCKRILNWSNAQVLMRFMILQAFLTPLLFILFVKVR